MPVSVVCPSCDMEQAADTPGGTIQCRTCWAKVPVPSVTPATPPPARDFPAALEGAPPRAKRAQPLEPAARVNRPEKSQEKPGGWVGAMVLLMAVIVVGGAVVVFMWPVAGPTAATTSTPSRRERPTESGVEWQQRDTDGGAKLLAPGQLDREDIAVRDGTATRPGQRFTATDDDGNSGEVFSFRKVDRVDREALVASFMEVPAVNVTRVGVRAIRGGDATEYTGTVDGFEHTALVIGRDGGWHVFHLKLKRGTDTEGRRKEQFVATAEVTWTRQADPDPAPPKPVKPKDQPKPADPMPKDPPKVTDSKGEAEPITEAWGAIENKAGFTAVGPKGVKSEKLIVPLNRLPLGGQKWQMEDAHCLYHLSYLDLPVGFEPDLQKLVKPLLGFGDSIAGSDDGKVDGRKATLWDLWKWDKQKAKGVTVACGFRLFTAFVSSKQGKGYGDDATFTRRTDKFLNSLAFTFDPKADDPYPGEAKWSAVENTAGFRAMMPTATTAVKEYGVGFPRILGRQYRAEAGGIAYAVSVHEVPVNRTPAEVVKGVLGHDKLLAGPVEVKGSDRKWMAYELGSPDRPVLVRTVTVGKRVYTLRTHPEPSGDERAGAREFRDKSAMFFDSVTVDE